MVAKRLVYTEQVDKDAPCGIDLQSTRMEHLMRKACGFVVFRRRESDGAIEILLLHSTKWREWGFPKGHVDPGEDEMQTALRELCEETGLRETDIRLVTGFRSEIEYLLKKKSQKWKRAVYFLAEIQPDAKVCLSREHDEYAWTDRQRAEELFAHEQLTEVLGLALGHPRLLGDELT